MRAVRTPSPQFPAVNSDTRTRMPEFQSIALHMPEFRTPPICLPIQIPAANQYVINKDIGISRGGDTTYGSLTAEAVCAGHPDKICDQVADSILDAVLARDPHALVGCEASVCGNKLHIFGEITTDNPPDYEAVARQTLREIGYTDPASEFCADTCQVDVDLHEQSPDIVCSVKRLAHADAGAGDAGSIYGFACDETEELMPLPFAVANAMAQRLEEVRRDHSLPYLLPDGKTQIGIEYRHGLPARVASVMVCAQHAADVDIDTVREQVADQVIRTIVPVQLMDGDTLVYVNPTGRFVKGGPAAKAGLTGRKTTADTYGSCARWGGSALSGKDGSKVNRSGAYLARYLAKNIVAAGMAQRCEVRLSYALGLADPLTVSVDTLGTAESQEDDGRLTQWVLDNVDMRPAKIIERFNLRRPIFRALSVHGHFGQNAARMPWEATDLAGRIAAELR